MLKEKISQLRDLLLSILKMRVDMVKTNIHPNHKKHDSVEQEASKIHSVDAVEFLIKKCDGHLSTTEARRWVGRIAKSFPESRLSLTYHEL